MSPADTDLAPNKTLAEFSVRINEASHPSSWTPARENFILLGFMFRILIIFNLPREREGTVIHINPRTINISIYVRNRCDGDKERNINICQIPPILTLLSTPPFALQSIYHLVLYQTQLGHTSAITAHPFSVWSFVPSASGNFAFGQILIHANNHHDLQTDIIPLRLFRKVISRFYDILRWRPQIKENAVKLIRLERVGGP